MFDSVVAFIKGLFTKKNAVRAVLSCAAIVTTFFFCPWAALPGYPPQSVLCFVLNCFTAVFASALFISVYEELMSIIKGAYAHSC